MEINFKPRAGVTTEFTAGRPDPAGALRIHARDMAGAGFYVGLVISLGFLGAGCGMIWSWITDMRTVPLLIIGGLFAAVGGTMTFASVRILLDRIRHGNVALQVSRPLPEAGGRLEARLALSAKAAAAGRVSVEFTCLRIRYVKDTSGRKSSIRRDEEKLWSTRAEVPITGSRADIGFDIPDGLPAATLEPERTRFISVDDPPRHEWILRVVADIPGVDLDRSYLVPVAAGKSPVFPAIAAKPVMTPVVDVPSAGAVPAPAGHSSLAMLVLCNLPPLAGVVFLGWRVGDVVMLYWVENLIIGAVNVLRMATCGRNMELAQDSGPLLQFLARLPVIAFFIFHYGMFCFVHGIFLAHLFGGEAMADLGDDVFGIITVLLREPGLAMAMAGLAVSHLFSFFHNFIGGGERRNVDINAVMIRPYGRIVVVHLFIFLGAALTGLFGETPVVMAGFVLLKVFVDAGFHLQERKALGARA